MEPPSNAAPAVLRAGAILDLLATAEQPLRLVEIANRLELAVSSASALLAALEHTGMAVRRADGYVLGRHLVELARSVLASDDVVQAFYGAVPRLPRLRNETVQLGVLDRTEVLYLARRDGRSPISISSSIGARLPASTTAIGKVLLAGQSGSPLDEVLSEPLARLTPKSVTDPDELRRQVEEAGRQGFAVDDEETTVGVMCLAVPTTAIDGQQVGLSVTMLKAQIDETTRQALLDELLMLARLLA